MDQHRTTIRLSASRPDDISSAANLLRAGKLVAFATETVYGLGANALSAEAVAGIFAAKQRPSWDPLIVHIADLSQLPLITAIPTELRPRVTQLAAAFWPGPLTLLLPRGQAVPYQVTAGRDLVGVRIPSHAAALALLAEAGLPVAAPSANRFGHTSPTTAQHVLADLEGRIDAVLDAGPTSVGVESTVIDPTQTPMVLYRPGAVTVGQLTTATGIAVTIYQPAHIAAEPQTLPSPGVGIRHYAPIAALVLVEPDETDLDHSLLAANELALKQGSVGILLPDGWAALPGSHVFAWGGWNAPETLAAKLFAGLRDLDERGVASILCPMPPAGGLKDALRDRLSKAALAK